MTARSIFGCILGLIATNEFFAAFQIFVLRPRRFDYTFGPITDGIFSIVIGCILALIATALLLKWPSKALFTLVAMFMVVVLTMGVLTMNIMGTGRNLNIQ